jgi:predicted nuclease with TOPRIM domain
MTYVVSFGKGVRETFGEAYDDFVEGLNAIAKNQEADVVRQVEERFHRVVVEAKSELKEEISQVRQEMAHLETKMAQLETKIATLHVSQLRWMFVFWIGQVGATLAIFSLLLMKQ